MSLGEHIPDSLNVSFYLVPDAGRCKLVRNRSGEVQTYWHQAAVKLK